MLQTAKEKFNIFTLCCLFVYFFDFFKVQSSFERGTRNFISAPALVIYLFTFIIVSKKRKRNSISALACAIYLFTFVIATFQANMLQKRNSICPVCAIHLFTFSYCSSVSFTWIGNSQIDTKLEKENLICPAYLFTFVIAAVRQFSAAVEARRLWSARLTDFVWK